MRSHKSFLKHLLSTLIGDKFSAFIAAIATLASLIINYILSPNLELIRILPIIISSIYLVYHLREIYILASSTYNAVSVPYSICLAKTSDWHKNTLRLQEEQLLNAGIPWISIQSLFRIHKYDWAYFDTKKLSYENGAKDWMASINDVENHFDRLLNRIDKQVVVHFFFTVPESFAFILGTKIGHRVTPVVYQYAGFSQKPYFVVFDTSAFSSIQSYSMTKQRISQFEKISINEIPGREPKSSSIIVSLEDIGHPLPKSFPDCSERNIFEAKLNLDYKNQTLISQEWTLAARESFSLVSSKIEEGLKVHLFLGLPSSLSFLVGMLLKSNNDIIIYHYNRPEKKYYEVFNFSKL